jgi:hypothetical protein
VVRRASLSARILGPLGPLVVLLATPCGAPAAVPARLLGNAAALDGARIGAPLTVTVSGGGVTSVRYVLDGRYLGKTSTPPFAWHIQAPAGEHELKARLDGIPGSLTATFTVGLGAAPYVGSANSNWSRYSDGRPDTSDRNRIVGSTIWATGAESIDIKEGTAGGTVRGNHLDGVGMSGENHSDSLIDVKGDGWLIAGNSGTVSGASAVVDGFQVHDVYRGKGKGNVFRSNDLSFPEAIEGYGTWIQGRNTISCGNRVRGASSGLANVPCAR